MGSLTCSDHSAPNLEGPKHPDSLAPFVFPTPLTTLPLGYYAVRGALRLEWGVGRIATTRFVIGRDRYPAPFRMVKVSFVCGGPLDARVAIRYSGTRARASNRLRRISARPYPMTRPPSKLTSCGRRQL